MANLTKRNFDPICSFYFAGDPIEYAVLMHKTDGAGAGADRNYRFSGIIADAATYFLLVFGVIDALLGMLK